MLSVTKPTGHYSHILNGGTDNVALDAAKAAHKASKGPAVGNTLVQPNGAQLQEVRVCGSGLTRADVISARTALSIQGPGACVADRDDTKLARCSAALPTGPVEVMIARSSRPRHACVPLSKPQSTWHKPQIANLIAAGKVKLEVALSLPLAEVAEAHDQVRWAHLLHGDATGLLREQVHGQCPVCCTAKHSGQLDDSCLSVDSHSCVTSPQPLDMHRLRPGTRAARWS